MTAKKTENQEAQAFPEPSKDEILQARADGVKDAIKESTKDAYKTGANEGYGTSESSTKTFEGSKDVSAIQDWVDLDIKELEKRIKGDGERPITEARIVGLLEVERSGKNRTEVVQVLCKRLGIKSPYEATAAGPAYTNDTTSLSKL